MERKQRRERLESFCFAKVDVRVYAFLRLAVGSLAFLSLLDFVPLLRLHFSNQGWLAQPLPSMPSLSWGFSVFHVFASPAWVVAIVVSTLLALLCFALGFKTRFMGAWAFVGLLSLQNKNPLLFDGDDQILRVILLLLLLVPCGAVWSWDSRNSSGSEGAPIWPLQLIRAQILVLYIVNGVSKLYGSGWWDGSAMGRVLFHPVYARWSWSDSPTWVWSCLQVVFVATPYFEIGLALLLCVPATRKWGMLLGVSFHLGLLVFLELRWFGWTMLGLYAVFWNGWLLPDPLPTQEHDEYQLTRLPSSG